MTTPDRNAVRLLVADALVGLGCLSAGAGLYRLVGLDWTLLGAGVVAAALGVVLGRKEPA